MKICFHSNQLSLRGSEIALYDYAYFNETLLGNESIILSKNPEIQSLTHPLGIKKFKDRFKDKVFFYNDFHIDGEKILKEQGIDVLYMIKAGMNDGLISHNSNIKTVIHSVFQYHEKHGHIYAYVSEWLGRMFNCPFVPHIVTLPDINEDLREELNIPKNAIVYGRLGGLETFNIPFSFESIKNILNKRDDIYFLFLYTNKFYEHKNIIYLEGTEDEIYKRKFINTCDAMIHSRLGGESFGLAVASFSLANKPVITFNGGVDQAHLEMLGDKAIKYNNYEDLSNILLNFKPNNNIDWNCYRQYNPENVMKKFKEVFLK